MRRIKHFADMRIRQITNPKKRRNSTKLGQMSEQYVSSMVLGIQMTSCCHSEEREVAIVENIFDRDAATSDI